MSNFVKTEMKGIFEEKEYDLYDPEQYDDPAVAWEVLTALAYDRSMSEEEKASFNRNFYGYIVAFQSRFGVEILRPVARGVDYLLSLSPDDRDRMFLKGDFYGKTWKLLDKNSLYGMAWRPETKTCRFPSQYLHLAKVVFLNDLHKMLKKSELIKKAVS